MLLTRKAAENLCYAERVIIFWKANLLNLLISIGAKQIQFKS